MSTPEPPRLPSTAGYRWTFAAAIVALIGLVILTISGLCTGTYGIMMVIGSISESHGLSSGDILGALVTMGIVGGIPMLVGFLMLRTGWKMRRKQ